MSSCFLLKMQGDSIDGIYDTLKQCAVISKSAGGIGVAAPWLRRRMLPQSTSLFVEEWSNTWIFQWVVEWMMFGVHIHHPLGFKQQPHLEDALPAGYASQRRFPTFAPVAPTSAAPTVGVTAWSPCCGTSTRRRATLIKAQDLWMACCTRICINLLIIIISFYWWACFKATIFFYLASRCWIFSDLHLGRWRKA